MGNRWNAVLFGILVATKVAGCAADPVSGLGTPDQLTLYSIDGEGKHIEPLGDPRDESAKEKPKDAAKQEKEEFYGFPVLGKIEIADAAKRKEIMNSFKKGIESSDGAMAKCFWPRHGIRVVHAGRTVDYVICFECLQFDVHEGATTSRKPIAPDPQALMNKILKDAGIPLPRAAETDEADDPSKK